MNDRPSVESQLANGADEDAKSMQERHTGGQAVNAKRNIYLLLLIIAVVLVGTIGKIVLNRLASNHFATARRTIDVRVSADMLALDDLAPALTADRQTIEDLADQKVPTKEIPFSLSGAKQTESNMVSMGSDRGFSLIGVPAHSVTVEDSEAAARLVANKKAAAKKLLADESAYKRAADRLAKDQATAEGLAKRTARWQDAFVTPGPSD